MSYIVSCCSTADLSKNHLEGKGIPYIEFHYYIEDKEYADDLYTSITPKEFYNMIAEGAMPTTSQVSPAEYISFWKKYLDEGKDVLHLTLSSGISGSYQSALVAQNDLREEYPDRKIVVIDSLSASSGYGLLVDDVYENMQNGMTLEENEAWILENRINLHHWFFSSDLTSFIRGGRVSKTSGFFGTLLNICPLLNVNSEGKLIPRVKCRGTHKAIRETFTTMQNHVRDGKDYNGKVYISHSDSREDAEALADLIRDYFPNIDGDILINNIGTVIGSHTGPGTVALFFWGDERTL